MLSSDKNVETIAQLIEVLKHYFELHKEYLKLDVIDKVVRLLAGINFVILLLFVALRKPLIERPLVRFLASLFMS